MRDILPARRRDGKTDHCLPQLLKDYSTPSVLMVWANSFQDEFTSGPALPENLIVKVNYGHKKKHIR